MYVFEWCIHTEDYFNLCLIKFTCRHRRGYCPDTGKKLDVTVQKEYDSQPSRLEEQPSGVVCQKGGYAGSAKKKTTIIEEDDRRLSVRVPSIVIQFGDIPLQVAK